MTKQKFDFQKIGFSTEKSDCEAAGRAIQALYAVTGKNPPKEIIWVKSPCQAVQFSQMMDGLEKKNGWGLPIKDILSTTQNKIMTRYSFGTRSVVNNTLDMVKEKIRTDLKFPPKEPINKSLYCSFNYREFHELYASLGRGKNDLKATERNFIELMAVIMANASWMVPYENKCIVSEKPVAYHVNARNEPHFENGRAIEWGDGWGLYALEGRVIPGWIITNPEKITVKLIRKEQNAETRRLMTEKMGISKYLEECKAKVIDMDSIYVFKDGDDRTMPRALMEDDEGNKYFVGTDGSTERVYYMNVDPRCLTCAEAHTSIAGFNENVIIANS